MSQKTIRIGCGSASSEDRIEPAIALIEGGDLDFMVLDCLAERTLAFAQLRKLADREAGYDLRLELLVRELIVRCLERGARFVANMGAANPAAAARRTRDILAELGHTGVRVAAVTGDDVLDLIREHDPVVRESGRRVSEIQGEIVSANAYVGADAIISALEQGAQVVLGGRIADPSLFMAPAAFAHGWSAEDLDLRAGGQTIGHLLECATYVTGANWVDPPYRTVPDLWNLAPPFAEVNADGTGMVSKLDGTGGIVSVDTCKAELIYEIGDPSNYITPDLVLDVRDVRFADGGPNRVLVSGARGKPATDTLKVLIGVLEGFIAEGEVSFGGPGALERAQLCAETVQTQLERREIPIQELRVDYIGRDSMFGAATPSPVQDPWEVRMRMAVRVAGRPAAETIAQALTLTWFGPAGAGGVRTNIRQVLGMSSALMPRDEIAVGIEILEV